MARHTSSWSFSFEKKLKFPKQTGKIFLYVLFAISLIVVYIYGIMQPSNNRNWDIGHATLAHITINSSKITLENVRNFKHVPNKTVAFDYINRAVDLQDLEKVWFVMEPFSKNPAFAHTYFVFDFKDHDPLAVSVEARAEKDEKYSVYKGAVNQFELIYNWGSETDFTTRRAIIENNKLFMYPLKISDQGAKNLFLAMLQTTQSLETKPRFYHTLLSNCTNELAKVANKVKPNAIPFHYAQILPGYSAELLYNLGYIPDDESLEQVSEKYFITDFVKENYQDPDFSKKLREHLDKD